MKGLKKLNPLEYPPQFKATKRFLITFRCPHCKKLISVDDLKGTVKVEME